MSVALSAADPWMKYLAEMTAGTMTFGRLTSGDEHLEFEATLEVLMEEHRVTKERLGMLQKHITKMLEIKQERALSECEIAQRKLMLLEKEGDLVRKIIPGINTAGNEIDEKHFLEGNKAPDRDLVTEIDFMDDFSVALEDPTRCRIDYLDARNGLASHDGSARNQSSHSVDAFDVNNRPRDSDNNSASEVVRFEPTTVMPNIPRNPSSTGSADDWVCSKSPEELREVQKSIQRALAHGGEEDGREGRMRRRLSKRHRFKPKTEVSNATSLTIHS